MAIPNQKLREILFVLLFAEGKEEVIPLIMEQLQVSKSNVMRALEKALLIRDKGEEIDNLLRKVVVSYDLERIQKIEKTALKIGVYELIFAKELPPKVALAEAVRLTKKFGTPAATAFVLALLDAILKQEQGKVVDQKEIQHSLEALQDESNQIPPPDSSSE